jgi:uncharacterized protein YecT (DUF1311 family)
MTSKIVYSLIDNIIKAIFIILLGVVAHFFDVTNFFNVLMNPSDNNKVLPNNSTQIGDINEQNKKAEQLLKELEQERKMLETIKMQSVEPNVQIPLPNNKELQSKLAEKDRKIDEITAVMNEQKQKTERLQQKLEQESKTHEPVQTQVVEQTIQRPMNMPFKPSFPCARASTDSEFMVCSHAELAAVDVEMSDIYKTVLENTVDKKALRREQNKWRTDYRDPCTTDVVCILNTYTVRIKQLKENYR